MANLKWTGELVDVEHSTADNNNVSSFSLTLKWPGMQTAPQTFYGISENQAQELVILLQAALINYRGEL